MGHYLAQQYSGFNAIITEATLLRANPAHPEDLRNQFGSGMIGQREFRTPFFLKINFMLDLYFASQNKEI